MKQADRPLQQLVIPRIPADIGNSTSYKRFMDAINNPQTREKYEEMFGWFIERVGAKSEKDLIGISDEKAEDKIISYIRYLKEDGLKPTTIRTRLAPLILYYEMNRKRLAWKIVKRTIPKGNNKSKDRGYSREEVQKLLAIAPIREQAMITLIASTGMRRGALPLLRMRNLMPIDDYKLYEIVVYEGEAEEYHTYTTPEARSKLDSYFAYRQQYGETLIPDSYVFRKDWNLRARKSALNPSPITEKTITAAFDQIANKSGVRKRQHVGHRKDSNATDIGRKAGRVRYQQKILHGLRKFYESALLDAGFPENWLDMLEGHKLKGLRENYYRPKDRTVLLGTTTADGKVHLPGFLDLMPELIINDEDRLKGQVSTLKTEALRKETDMEKRIEEAVEKKIKLIFGRVDITQFRRPNESES